MAAEANGYRKKEIGSVGSGRRKKESREKGPRVRKSLGKEP